MQRVQNQQQLLQEQMQQVLNKQQALQEHIALVSTRVDTMAHVHLQLTDQVLDLNTKLKELQASASALSNGKPGDDYQKHQTVHFCSFKLWDI